MDCETCNVKNTGNDCFSCQPSESASTPCNALEHGIPYVIRKNGMYYAHNSCGYTASVLLAELYTEDYAKRHAKSCDECQAVPVTELLHSSDKVQRYIDRLEVMRDAMIAIDS